MSKRYPHAKSFRWLVVGFLDLFLDFSRIFLRKKAFPASVRSILVVRLDHIGDIVSSLPVFSILKAKFPDAKLTALVSAEGSALLKFNPNVDRVIEFRRNWFCRKGGVDWGELCGIARELRREKFDLGYDLRGDARNILLMTCSGARYRIGYGIGGGGGLLHREAVYDPAAHQVVLSRNLVTEEPIEMQALRPRIYITESEKAAARRRLQETGISEENFVIAAHPEAGYSSKEWEFDKFRKLVDILAQNSNSKVVILGTTPRAEEVSSTPFHKFLSKFCHCPVQPGNLDSPISAKHRDGSAKYSRGKSGNDTLRVLSLVGTLSLRELAGVLSVSNLFIGNDSGPSHIAQALGIPVIVLASGTNEYEKWGVWLEPMRILKAPVPCAPCHLKKCSVKGHPCMSAISVEEVLEAVRSLGGEAAA